MADSIVRLTSLLFTVRRSSFGPADEFYPLLSIAQDFDDLQPSTQGDVMMISASSRMAAYAVAAGSLLSVMLAAPAFSQDDPDNTPPADGPSSRDFKIADLRVSGTGCATSSTTFKGRSSTNGGVDYFQAVYDEFIVKRGPKIKETNSSKGFNERKCKITMLLDFPEGMRFKLKSSQYDGFADIADGAFGGFRATYFFDKSEQDAEARFAERRKFKGPLKESYVIRTKFRHKSAGKQNELWSPCKRSAEPMYFQVNTAIRLRGNREANSLLSIDVASGVFTQKMDLKWVKC